MNTKLAFRNTHFLQSNKFVLKECSISDSLLNLLCHPSRLRSVATVATARREEKTIIVPLCGEWPKLYEMKDTG